MLGARVGHQLERHAALLQRAHQHGGVGEQHVVIGHAVDQQQRRGQAVDVAEHTRLGVAIRVVARQVHVALGVVGVIQAPVGHRCAGNAAGIPVRGLGQQHQGHVAAIGPAVHANALGIHPGLGGEPFNALELVFHFHRALAAVQRAAEITPTARGATVVQREHHIALLGQVLVEQRIATAGPAVAHGLAGRAAVDVGDHRVLAGGVEVRRGDQAVVQLGAAIGGGEGAELQRALGGQIRCIRVVGGGQVVLQQRGDLRTVGLEQLDLRRRARIGPAVDIDAGIARKAGAVHARHL